MANSHTQALGLKVLLRLYFNGENRIWMVNDKINFRPLATTNNTGIAFAPRAADIRIAQ